MTEIPTILYVDDEHQNCMLFEINLRKHFNVLTAISGLEGLDVLEKNREVSIVVSDIRMPGMNGLEFLKITAEKYPDLKRFVLTGYEINSDINKALNEKLIINYFRKPLNRDEIISSIQKNL